MVIRIGTRGSELALVQARYVQSCFKKQGMQAEIVIIETRGDKDLRDFRLLAGDGFFTKEIERKLLRKEVDVAIHSAKDLASLEHADLPWAALGPRENPKDILIARKGLDLQKTFVLGTSSPRRQAQVRAHYPLAQCKILRGNVPTRMHKVLSGEYDAVILAKAGFHRLELEKTKEAQDLQILDCPWVTAPCQGILALQSHKDHFSLVEKICDPELTIIAKSEKNFLKMLGGGCQLAIGTHIEKQDQHWNLKFYLDADTTMDFELNASDLESLQQKGFEKISGSNTSVRASRERGRVVLTQGLNHQLNVATLLQEKGFTPISWPLFDVQSCIQEDSISKAKNLLQNPNLLVFSSSNAARIFLLEYFSLGGRKQDFSQSKIYTIGEETRALVAAFNLPVEPITYGSYAKSLMSFLLNSHPEKPQVIFPATKDSKFLEVLKAESWPHTFIEAYQTRPTHLAWRPESSDLLVFANALAVDHAEKLLGLKKLSEMQLFSFGPSTQKALEDRGLSAVQNTTSGSWEGLVSCIEKTVR